MHGVLLIINLMLTAILAFTHWLAVYIKQNPYLISLAIYNTNIAIIFALFTIEYSGMYSYAGELVTMFFFFHIAFTVHLIKQSWKEDVEDEFNK